MPSTCWHRFVPCARRVEPDPLNAKALRQRALVCCKGYVGGFVRAPSSHCCAHLFYVAECTECCHTSKTDPDRDQAIGFRLKTLPELFEVYLGGTHRACQKIEVF